MPITKKIFSHTCSNTEIVCALGLGHMLVGVDDDSDFPPEVVGSLPKAGRDLNLQVDKVLALKPDLVLTSLTVPGHDKVVAALEDAGLPLLVCDPVSLDDVYEDIRRIGNALDVAARADALVASMEEKMPRVEHVERRPKILVEWWPKPVIAPGRQSWVTDIIDRAGGINPWGEDDVKSQPLSDAAIQEAAPDMIAMSWCGVKVENYRAKIVRGRSGWENIPAIQHDRIYAISEEFLGRPGPRLVRGYEQLRHAIMAMQGA